LVLISSIYLMLKGRYTAATILVSFLPFVRNEGYFLFPLFFVVLVYHRKYITTLWFATGTLLYSIAGYFYYKDFLWLIHQNPYDGKNRAFYGQGPLLHFVKNYNFLWGSLLTILFALGIAAILYRTFVKTEAKEKQTFLSKIITVENVLIVGSFAIYFAAHSYMWWKGLANSLGLLRVIAAVMPCSALICLRGFNALMIPYFRKQQYIEYGIIVLSIFWIVRSPFKHEYYPYKLNPEEAVIKEAGDWFQTSAYTKQKVFYLYPYLAHVLNVDSFDPNKVGELWGLYPSIKAWGISAIPDSTVVFWDAHFGPNECHIPLDSIMDDPNFMLIKTFKPAQPFQVLGGYNMEVDVFMKLPKPRQMEIITKEDFDLETAPSCLLNTSSFDDKFYNSGKHSSKLFEGNEYSVTYKKGISELPINTRAIEFSFKLLDPNNNSSEAATVISIDDSQGKNLLWQGLPLAPMIGNNTPWKNVTILFAINPNKFPKDASIKLYVWNKKHKEFYVDDLGVVCKGWK